MTPIIGLLMQETSTKKFLRVCHVDPAGVDLIVIGDKRKLNFKVPLAEFQEKSEASEWVEHKPYTNEALNEDDGVAIATSPAGRAHGAATFGQFKDALSDVSRLLTEHGRAALYRELKEQHPKLTKKTFYKVVRRWLEGGMTPKCLDARWYGVKRTSVDRTDLDSIPFETAKRACQAKALAFTQTLAAPQRSGETRSRHRRDHLEGKQKRRARASTYQPSHYLVCRDTLRVFLQYFKRKAAGDTLQDLYDAMRAEVFATAHPIGLPEKWPLWAVPTFAQFKYYYRQLVSLKDAVSAKQSSKHYNGSVRSKLGQSSSPAYTAGAVGEIDATIWPINLVGEGPDAPLIGTPVVFRVRCRDTGQLMGISVSLESASWNSAALAIVNCIEDKTEFCRSLGIEHMPFPWDVRGLPARILADQGETYNHLVERFARFSGVAVDNLPGGRGDLKPGVESDWHVLQVRLSGKAPGAIVAEWAQTTNKQWQAQAQMTLKQFKRYLVLEELERMHEPRHNLKMPEAMMSGGERPASTAPHDLWRWCIRHGAGAVKMVDERELRLSVLPTERASVTEHGLTFRDLHFVCDPLALADEHARARRQGRRTVAVAYDPLLVDTVFLLEGDDDTAPTAYHPARLNTQTRRDQRAYMGKTWREVLVAMEAQKLADLEAEEKRQKAVDQVRAMKQSIRDESEAAVADARQSYPTSTSALINGKAAARLVEKNAVSPQQAISAPLQEPPAGPAAAVVSIAQVRARTETLPAAPPPASSSYSRRLERMRAAQAGNGAPSTDVGSPAA